MREMTAKEEIDMRAKTLHRRVWLNRMGTATGFERPYSDVSIGPLTIKQMAGSWLVTLVEDGVETIVYYGDAPRDESVSEEHVKRTLQILRTAMILEDLADV